MGKFDDLQNIDKIVNNASLKNNSDTKNLLIYNIPKVWTSIIKQNGFSFSSYAKMAILEKLKKDNLI